jgi:demethylmenaquinone methyltransferase / 2-methoxy-6-polyprenyl-1,4-benzoquinol methylase
MQNLYNHDTVVPNKDSQLAKKEQVAEMFNNIAPTYDKVNRLLSVGIDIGWRKKAINELKNLKPQLLLDVATGTADMALLIHKQLQCNEIIGVDISNEMLAVGRNKIKEAGLDNHIKIFTGDSEHLEFNSNTFNAVTVTFGVRNFENLNKGLTEIYRVLQPGGKLVVLEFSKPKALGFKQLYSFYMNVVAPKVGSLFANNKEAYAYLNKSVKAFPEGQEFLNILNEIGFTQTYLKRLSLGICTIYCGSK